MGSVTADALVIGVTHGPDGPTPAAGTAGILPALGATLTAALTALGASGEAEEITKIPANGSLAAPLIVAVGLGAAPENGKPFDTERLRRAAGAAVRDLAGGKLGVRDESKGRRVAVALPAGDWLEYKERVT